MYALMQPCCRRRVGPQLHLGPDRAAREDRSGCAAQARSKGRGRSASWDLTLYKSLPPASSVWASTDHTTADCEY